MIRVALNGGLGNQMFQYATGRALSVVNNTNLLLDLISLQSKLQSKQLATYRKFELDIFTTDAVINKPVFTHKYLYPFAKANFYFNIAISKIKYNYFKEKSFEFDAALLKQPDNTYLDGHFQTEKYFKNIENLIRNELKFKDKLSGKNLHFKNKIESCNAVSLHIRRGDYLLNKKNLNKHGVTSLNYYYKAVSFIASKIDAPVFFVFTDDLKWTKENFNIDFPFEIVDENTAPETSHLDMHLMSLCSHNIICNSTFSWWAAWLNDNQDKIVIAPSKWFEDSSINSKDIYPSEWIKL
ncbi:MAG: alpha-1,2-fucosyltransferase [Chitinophagales bacterium]|nr:alpha-1,2-fucosyltransferase [Chitinophagales bacterium]